MFEFTYQDSQNRVSETRQKNYGKEHSQLLSYARSCPEEYRDVLGWLDPEDWASQEQLARLEEKAKEVREKADAFVLVGVGGSNNAARSVIKALDQRSGCKVYYAGNTLSPYEINRLLRELEGKSVYIDVIAKNFETLEPGSAFRVLRKFLQEKYGSGAAERIIATGTPGSHLEELCREHGYTFLTFPEPVGGRYSALTDVGLFPMAAAGIDIRKVVQGAKDMRQLLWETDGMDNPAYRYAVIRNLLYQEGIKMEMLSFFEPRYRFFAKWWIQLFAESEGKDGKGIYPVAAECSEDLHSVGQFVQDGSHVMAETFLEVRNQDAAYVLEKDQVDDRFDYLNGVDFWEINRKAFEATRMAHSQCLPCFTITVDAIDEYSFGQLFYFFEFACFLSGKLLGVNPFDQPGVEAYKGYMFKALGKPENIE